MKNHNTFAKAINMGAYNGGTIVLTPTAFYRTEEGGGSTASAELKPSEMRLEVQVGFARESGAKFLTTTNEGGNYFEISDENRTLTIHLANMMAGVSRVVVRAKVGTATKVVYICDLFVRDGAQGLKPSAIDTAEIVVVEASAKSFGTTEQNYVFPTIATMVSNLNSAAATDFSVPANLWVISF